MSKIFVIAVREMHKQRYLRLYRHPEGDIKDISESDLKFMGINKLENAVFENGKLRGTTGSLEKIVNDNNIVIIEKQLYEGKIHYICVASNGKVLWLNEQETCELMRKYNCLNATLVNNETIRGINWEIKTNKAHVKEYKLYIESFALTYNEENGNFDIFSIWCRFTRVLTEDEKKLFLNIQEAEATYNESVDLEDMNNATHIDFSGFVEETLDGVTELIKGKYNNLRLNLPIRFILRMTKNSYFDTFDYIFDILTDYNKIDKKEAIKLMDKAFENINKHMTKFAIEKNEYDEAMKEWLKTK